MSDHCQCRMQSCQVSERCIETSSTWPLANRHPLYVKTLLIFTLCDFSVPLLIWHDTYVLLQRRSICVSQHINGLMMSAGLPAERMYASISTLHEL